MTTLVSAVYGGYDQVRPLPPDHGFDQAVLVTDRPVDTAGWEVVVEPRPGVPPRLAAKRAKCLPWLYVDDPQVLWLDASFEVLPGAGLRSVVDEHLTDSDLVAWRHPSGRVDAYQEAEFSLRVPEYQAEPLRAQTAAYEAEGLPRGSGLWEVGFHARRRTPATLDQGAAWLDEIERWSIQDQVSFPYACWLTGAWPSDWRAASQWVCGWVRWHGHRGLAWWGG